MSRILFILTSHDRMLNSEPTGLWVEEHAVPYLAFTGAGHEIVVSSMAGGTVPVIRRASPRPDRPTPGRRRSPGFDTLETDGFDAVYLPGGHGTVFDMPYNKKLHDLLFHFDATGRLIASVCHTPAVFAGMRRPDGTAFIAAALWSNCHQGFAGLVCKRTSRERITNIMIHTRLREG